MYMYMHMHMHVLISMQFFTQIKNVLTMNCQLLVYQCTYTDIMMVGISNKVLLQLTVVGGEGDS